MWNKIIFSVGGVALAGTTATAIALPLYIKAEAEAGLSNFIDMGGSVPEFEKNKPITYVALGDSITAGFNGFFHGSDNPTESKDYISYADFLAQDLKNAGLLKDYKNYAKSGDTIWDTNELIDESQAVNNAIKDADFITISIGSNDLLGAVTALGLPFATNLNKLLGNVQLPNHLREAIHSDSNAGIGGSNRNKLLANAIQKAAEILYKGETGGTFDIRKNYEETILNIIKRGLKILTRDLHQAAPKAHIQFIVPEFPLIGVSKKLESDPTDVTGKSMLAYFNENFIDTIKSGIEAQYTSLETFDNAFVDFISKMDSNITTLNTKITKLEKEYSEISKHQDKLRYITNILDGRKPTISIPDFTWKKPIWLENKYVKLDDKNDEQLKDVFLDQKTLTILKPFVTSLSARDSYESYTGALANYGGSKMRTINHLKAIKKQIADIKTRYSNVKTDKERTIIANEFMNNFADIHPSVRGHQVMGTYLFNKLLPLLKSDTIQSVEDMYQIAVPFTNDGEIEKFEELDEVDWTKSVVNKELYLKNPDLDDLSITNISRAINRIITQHPDGLESPLSEILTILEPILGTGSSVSSDVYEIDFNGDNFEDIFNIKGSTPGLDMQGFIAGLIKTNSSTEDEVDTDDKIWATIAVILDQELVVSDQAGAVADPNSNIGRLSKLLDPYSLNNIFDVNSITGGDASDSLREILTAMGITDSGDVSSALAIPWSTIPDTNKFKEEYNKKEYIKNNVKTLGDLLSMGSRAKTLSLLKTFLVDKIPQFTSDMVTENFKNLPSIIDRAVAIAKNLGLEKLGVGLTEQKTVQKEHDDFYQLLSDSSTFSVKQILGAEATLPLDQIVKLVIGDVPKKITDAAKQSDVIKKINDTYAKYKKLSATAVSLNDGIQVLMDILGMSVI